MKAYFAKLMREGLSAGSLWKYFCAHLDTTGHPNAIKIQSDNMWDNSIRRPLLSMEDSPEELRVRNRMSEGPPNFHLGFYLCKYCMAGDHIKKFTSMTTSHY